jgi:hypothetical protein
MEVLMNAKLIKRNGKYYSTEIEVNVSDGRSVYITISGDSSNNTPSERELLHHGLTRAEWDGNIDVEDGWGGTTPVRSADLIDWSHYEKQSVLDVAEKIVDAFNT